MATPRLSVVVAAARLPSAVPQLLEALAPPLASGLIEVIVATVATPPLDLAQRARIVQAAAGSTVPRLRSAGMAAARAELVAVTEDFCIPSPGWAEALLAAHDAHAAVAIGGPIDRREGRAADWALTFQEYGRFLGREAESPAHDLPGPNVSYKIERLRKVLGGLPDEFLEIEIHALLIQRGEELRRQPEALMYDANHQAFVPSLVSLYHHGRLFGGRRVRGRPTPVRALRAVLAPLAPMAQLSRIARGAVAAGRGAQLLASMPWLLALLVAWAIGEAIGSVLGEGRSVEKWT